MTDEIAMITLNNRSLRDDVPVDASMTDSIPVQNGKNGIMSRMRISRKHRFLRWFSHLPPKQKLTVALGGGNTRRSIHISLVCGVCAGSSGTRKAHTDK